jgi:hypothetical protein
VFHGRIVARGVTREAPPRGGRGRSEKPPSASARASGSMDVIRSTTPRLRGTEVECRRSTPAGWNSSRTPYASTSVPPCLGVPIPHEGTGAAVGSKIDNPRTRAMSLANGEPRKPTSSA